jgi:hypothetical protein
MDETSQDILKELQNYIDTSTEENTHLEFKNGAALKTTDAGKKEIAKDVAAMANADGGTIVFGLSEKNHKASEFSPVEGNTFSKEWLDQVIQSNIDRVPDYEIIPLRLDDDINRSIYVIRIKRSSNAPHLTSVRFFRRQNTTIRLMEEYEIRDAYFRTAQTKLVILDPIVRGNPITHNEGKISSYAAYIDFSIQNIGGAIEKSYKLLIYIPTGINTQGTGADAYDRFLDYRKDEWKVYSFPNKSPLFQNEQTLISTVPLEFYAKSFQLLEKGIKAQLLYSTGSTITMVPILNFLKHSGTSFREHDLILSCFSNRH